MGDVTAISDQSAVDLARDGDASAFERLYRAEVGRIYGLCLRMTCDRLRAETLTQDVFVRAWELMKSFRGDSSFSTWLYRVAINVVLGDMRSARRREARFQAEDDMEQFEVDGRPRDTAMDLEKAIAALPAQARAVLLLHDLEGYTHDEIGDLLGIAAGTSKAHLHRARVLMRGMLTS